ncbi:hypothetical protein P0N66_12535 [Desulfurivibrio alkaliphilus]|nr:hypothetical protein [Desulfurivibrio alkaliphilus]MDF1615778.1 hypothetical protein [Desulfurivibrio alkaliphilus]
MPPNQNPEQLARDRIDRQLALAGWVVQDNKAIDFNAGPGIAVREYRTDAGPADYVLFINGQAAGVIEAKAEDQGHKLTTVEDQSGRYAGAQRVLFLVDTKNLGEQAEQEFMSYPAQRRQPLFELPRYYRGLRRFWNCC